MTGYGSWAIEPLRVGALGPTSISEPRKAGSGPPCGGGRGTTEGPEVLRGESMGLLITGGGIGIGGPC